MTSPPAAREGGSPGDASPPPPDSLQNRTVLALAALRVATSIAVFAAGFRAISDDDYSRVVIAQQWAAAPKLDPSGTSWLPFPFWLNGAAMGLFGRGLVVAQAIAVALGIAATLLAAKAAGMVTKDRGAAWIAGVFVTLMGWSAWLGVATVPELNTAALTLFGAATLSVTSPRTRLFGALALLAATLSRYEPWPVAIAFALWNAADAARGSNHSDDAHPRPRYRASAPPKASASQPLGGEPSHVTAADTLRTRIVIAVASIVALAGPAAWIAWNRIAHGDPFHFVARVTAYRKALGEASNESVIARLVAYPVALAKEMPEVVAPFVVLLLLAILPRFRRVIVDRLRAAAPLLVLATAQIVALSVALVKDGAPTHHPERAVLFPAFALAIVIAGVAGSVVSTTKAGRGVWIARGLAIACALGLFVRAAAAPITDPSWYAHRESEVAMGRVVAEEARADERVLIEVTDYGYFAIEASSGRPERFDKNHDLDPRWATAAPTYESEAAFVRDLRARGFAFVIDAPGDGERSRSRFEGSPSRATARHRLSRVPNTP
ncbi:MAG: hypothetical protein U0441_07075 [Polyangiaceae bacterium]